MVWSSSLSPALVSNSSTSSSAPSSTSLPDTTHYNLTSGESPLLLVSNPFLQLLPSGAEYGVSIGMFKSWACRDYLSSGGSKTLQHLARLPSLSSETLDGDLGGDENDAILTVRAAARDLPLQGKRQIQRKLIKSQTNSSPLQSLRVKPLLVVANANKFKRHGCKHFDKISAIFRDIYATWMHAHPSTTAPPAIILPTPNDDDDEEEGCEVSPPPLRKGKKTKRDALSPGIAALLSNMNENSERRDERMEVAIEKTAKASSTSTRVSSCEKRDDEVLSPSKKDRDYEMFDASMLLLQKIPGIEMAQFAKVSKLLHDSEKWQKFFLSAPEDVRIG
ncbi:uncharacterized protein LOC132314771 [Cornus florida]|uniref:uncharacterized protein LOC132314771 n=1 Tax=Cornus florida TaxID=4283 RepID=UPI00289D3AB3|nr:uncharacterized protein LOC132314771 [Cornus florida]